MDKTNRTEMHRSFLIEGLPEPLTRASAHIQIFDNYIAGTRIRLRSVRDPRDPDTAVWTRILQQRFPVSEDNLACMRFAEVYLNDAEYAQFEVFEGTEIRKNRYFHEFDRRTFAFDVFLGKLWGLNIARVEFMTLDELDQFVPPPFAVLEVTNNPFFLGEVLVTKSFEDVRNEVAKFENQLFESSIPDE
jgi:CYTH domain-containing protein